MVECPAGKLAGCFMRSRLRTIPQFKLSGVMLATFWLAVCFAAWKIQLPPHWMIRRPNPIWPLVMLDSWRYFPIPTAIGSLFGHTARGFMAGILLYLCAIWLALRLSPIV
jgi:hypothetical protein